MPRRRRPAAPRLIRSAQSARSPVRPRTCRAWPTAGCAARADAAVGVRRARTAERRADVRVRPGPATTPTGSRRPARRRSPTSARRRRRRGTRAGGSRGRGAAAPAAMIVQDLLHNQRHRSEHRAYHRSNDRTTDRSRHRQARCPHARHGCRGLHLHRRRDRRPQGAAAAHRLAQPDGAHPPRHERREPQPADPGVRAAGRARRHRVRRLGPDLANALEAARTARRARATADLDADRRGARSDRRRWRPCSTSAGSRASTASASRRSTTSGTRRWR